MKLTEEEWSSPCGFGGRFSSAVANNLHEAIANHFSAVLPVDDTSWSILFGLHFSRDYPSNLIVCDFDGKVVRGDGGNLQHRLIISTRRFIDASSRRVLSTYSPTYADALTMIADGPSRNGRCTLLAAFTAGLRTTTITTEWRLSDTVGERMAKILGDADVLFLGNHGVITAAPTWLRRSMTSNFVERAAQTQILAMSTGKPLARLAAELIEQVAAQLSTSASNLATLSAISLLKNGCWMPLTDYIDADFHII